METKYLIQLNPGDGFKLQEKDETSFYVEKHVNSTVICIINKPKTQSLIDPHIVFLNNQKVVPVTNSAD